MPKRFESIIIELTNACNFTCPFCPSESITRPKGFMDPDILARIVQEASRDRLTATVQFGLMGEPFLHRAVFAMAETASLSGLRVRCFTNGSALTEKNIDRFIASHIDELYISYRGVDPEAFASLSSMDHGRYVGGIRALLKRAGEFPGKKVIIKCFKPSLADSLIRTGTMARKMKAGQSTEFVTHLLQGMGLPASLRPSRTAFHDTFDLGGNISVRLESIAKWNDVPEPTQGSGFRKGLVGACDGMRGHIGVLWNGDVTTCCKDYDGMNVLGNVGKACIADILDSPPARRFDALMRWCVLPTPYCQVCRGGHTLLDSLVNQLGSIAYFRTPLLGKVRD